MMGGWKDRGRGMREQRGIAKWGRVRRGGGRVGERLCDEMD